MLGIHPHEAAMEGARINRVMIRCDRCGTRFQWQGRIADRADFDRQTEACGMIDCPTCHHFVSMDADTMTFVAAGAGASAVWQPEGKPHDD
jgi:hypothetical protein